MKSELRNDTIIVSGPSRKSRYALSLGAIRFLRERNLPIPPEVEIIEREKLSPKSIDLTGYPYKTEPWPHQPPGVQKALSHKRFAFFAEMGTGKSKMALDAIGWLFWKKIITKALIVCPLSVFGEWKKQYKQHAAFGKLIVLKETKEARKFLTEVLPYVKEPTIVLLNYEKVPILEKELLKSGFGYVVADETTKVKSYRAKRTKALAKISKEATYSLIMTGTPVSKNLVDIFGQFFVMDKFWFGSSFWFFRNRYCIMGGWMQTKIVGYQREEELREIIDYVSYTVKKKDVLPDLPDRVSLERVVEMDPVQKKLYKKVSKEFLIELEQGKIDIKNAGSRLMKLQQIADGFVITADRTARPVSNTKFNEILNAIDEVPEEQRIVVWCRFIYELKEMARQIREQHPDRKVFTLYGETKDRDDLLDEFRAETGAVLISQIETGGMGIDLTCSHSVFFFSTTFEYYIYEQAKARNHRPGQKNAVTYVHIIMEKTIDRKIQKVLDAKRSLSDWVMDRKGNLRDLFTA